MADEAAPGLQDAFGDPGLADTAHKTQEFLDRMGDAVKSADDAFRSNTSSAYEYQSVLRSAIDEIRKHAKNVQDDGTVIREMIDLHQKASRALVDSQKRNREWADAVGNATTTIGTFGTLLSSTTGPEMLKSLTGTTNAFGQTLMKLGNNEVGVLGSAAKAAGAGLGILSVSASALISVIDAMADAQKSAVNTMLQSGVSSKEQTDAIRSGTDSILKAGAQYNLSQKESGALAMSLAKSGALLDRMGGHVDNASVASATYTREVSTLSAAHKAFGSDLSTLTQVGTQLGTRFNRTGEDFDDAFGKIIKTGRGSGQQMDYFLKNFSDLSSASRSVGTSFEQVLSASSRYSDEIRRGTLTVSDAINLTDAQSQSIEKQAAMFAMINQELPKLAKQLGLTGDVAHDIYRMTEIRAKGLPEEKNLLSDIPLKLAQSLAGRGGGRDEQFLIFNKLMPEFGASIKNMEGAFNLFNGSVDRHASSTQDQKAASMSAKETIDRMKSEGKDAAQTFDGASKNFESAVQRFTAGINPLVDAMRGKATGWVRDSIQATTGENATGYRTNEQQKSMSEFFRKTRATGGLIPEEGSYYLHAGERVSRAGQGGGGMSISLGGIQVSVGDRGDVRGQVSEAMDKLKGEVLQQVEEQWNSANLAQ